MPERILRIHLFTIPNFQCLPSPNVLSVGVEPVMNLVTSGNVHVRAELSNSPCAGVDSPRPRRCHVSTSWCRHPSLAARIITISNIEDNIMPIMVYI